MKNRFLKLCSMLLVIVLLANMLPMSIFAQEYRESLTQSVQTGVSAEDSVDIADVQIVDEIPEKRTKYTKEFLLSNGLHLATVYADAVHYESEDGWKEIDNTLKLNKEGNYSNTAGVWDVRFPQSLTGEKAVTVTKDGYTLSFRMTGELGGSLQAGKLTTQEMPLKAMNPTVAKPQSIDLTATKAVAEHPETVPEKQHSRLKYERVYEKTDVVYDLIGNQVKESIILESYRSDLQGYRYALEVGDLMPVLEEDGQITLYAPDQETVVMVMPAPYLQDALGEYCGDVQVGLIGKGSSYVLTYLLPQQWLAEQDRAWPVILDPIVQADLSVSNIKDQTVSENKVHDNNWGMMEVGHREYGKSRIFLKYADLPDLTSSDVVVDAAIQLVKASDGLPAVVNVHKVNATWEANGLTWANKPGYNTTIEDYVEVEEAGYYSWQVTDIVRDWYANANTGMMFKASDDVENAQSGRFKQFYSSDWGTLSYRPALFIQYRHNSGIEPYYTYRTMSAGNAGTAYLSDSTGQVKVVKQIASYGSTINPFNLNLVYNSDYFSANSNNNDNIQDTHGIDMLFGSGFSLDIIQSVEKATITNANGNYLVWHDGDGTDHYFAKQANGTYRDEDGLGLTMSVSGGNHIMTDNKGNRWTFTNGILTQMGDETGNTQWIEYQVSSAGKWFYNIYQTNKDSGIRTLVATIRYVSGTSYISWLKDAAGRIYNFAYAGGNLTDIYLDGQHIVHYDYSGHTLVGMKDMESGYQICFRYANGKVCHFQEWADETNSGVSASVEYKNDVTIYRDHGADRAAYTVDDILSYYTFDYAGRTVNACSTDIDGKLLSATNAVYSGSGNTENPRLNNRTLLSGFTGAVGQNIMSNSGFESGTTGWSFSGTGSTATLKVSQYTNTTGSASLEGWMDSSHTGTLSANYSINLQAGVTYTFSGYVSTSWISNFLQDGGIYLQVCDSGSGSWESQIMNCITSQGTNNWVRISVTFSPAVSGNHSLMIRAKGITGWFYVDDLQLETGNPTNTNLVYNGSLQNGNSGWLTQGNAQIACQNNNYFLRLVGDPETDTCAWQNVEMNEPGTQTYILSGWAWADSVPDNADNVTNEEDYAQDSTKRFGLQAILIYTDGQREYHYVPFCPDVSDWQFTSMTIVPKRSNTTLWRIQVVCAYEKNANVAWFDEISLVKEAAQTMRYDNEGNLVKVTSTGLEDQSAIYQNGNLMQVYTGGSGTYTYTYDTTYPHRQTSVTDGVLTQSLTYDSYGNVTGTTLTGGGESLSSSATYESGGNRLKSVTDVNGNIVQYGYSSGVSAAMGLPTSVTDGNNVVTSTNYDNQGRITRNTVENRAWVGYTYSSGNLSQIDRGDGQEYDFNHDAWGNTTSLYVGQRLLANYSYGPQNGALSTLTYGNADSISYTYDIQGRVTQAVYKDENGSVSRTLSYTYTGDGQLWSIHDSSTGETVFYTYDSLGRLTQSVKSGTLVSYKYDSHNRLINRSFCDITLGDGTETYTYDTNPGNNLSDGILTGMQMANGSTIAYEYEGLQRLRYRHTNSGKPGGGMWERFNYSGSQVTLKKNWIDNDTVSHEFYYTYDGNGNILTETETKNGSAVSYTYDNLNQLTGVTVDENGDGTIDYTQTYDYDNAGNLLSFNNGKGISHTYTYGDSSWKDLLTAVDGQAITYDAIGNPLSYYNGSLYTMSWAEGRRLQTVTVEGSTTGYEYNADGLRCRKLHPDGSYTVYHITDGQYVGESRYDANGVKYLGLRYIYNETGSVCGLSLWNSDDTDWTEYYLSTNLQGDVLQVYRAADNALVADYTYDPWGNILSATGSLATINPFRYRGYVYDEETGLYYVSSRYYDPEIGRWINADGQISGVGGEVLGYNMFAYCMNNPANMSDPSGNWPKWVSNAFNAVGNFLEKTWKALSQSLSISGEVGNGVGAKAKVGPVSLDITAIIVGDKWTRNSDGTNESVRQGALTAQVEIIDNVNVGVDIEYHVPLDEGKKKGLWCADGGEFDVVVGAFAYNMGLGYSTVSTQDVELSFGLAGYLYLGGGFEVSLNVSKFIEIWHTQ